MSLPRAPTKPHRVWDDPRIRLPDAETWAAMSERAQDRLMDAIVAVLDEYREAMSEGTRHVRRKVGAAGDLDAHFRRAGRGVYIGMELAVFYPGEAVIVPDVLAGRYRCEGEQIFADLDPNSFDRIMTVDVTIDILLVGRTVEKHICEKLQETYKVEYEIQKESFAKLAKGEFKPLA